MDTCGRHTSAPALSSPSCLFIPDWNASKWLTDTYTHSISLSISHTHSITGRAFVLFKSKQSHVHLYKIARKQRGNSENRRQRDTVSEFLCHTRTHTCTHKEVEYRWYSQSFSIAGDIPWHGFETQTMAVHCGAAAGTQGWAGTGIAHEQGREHHHPHPERLPGQPAHACPRTATSNGHVHHHYSPLFFSKPLLLSVHLPLSASLQKNQESCYTSRILL